MLKYTVKYEDYDGNPVTEDLYFNLNKTEATTDFEILDLLQRVQKQIQPPLRELEENEKRLMIEVVKLISEKAYGERIDSRHFDKDGAWKRLLQTPAWDAFLWGLFVPDQNEVVKFIDNVLPKDFREEGMAKMREEQPELYAQYATVVETPTHTIDAQNGSVKAKVQSVKDSYSDAGETSIAGSVITDSRPAWVVENRPPTDAEVDGMTKEQLVQVMKYKSTGSY